MIQRFPDSADLDRAYTQLAQAIGRVGEANAPRFLATLALALLIREGCSADALNLIAQAERLAAE